MANFSTGFHMKSLPFTLCIGVLWLCRLTFCAGPFARRNSNSREVRRTNLIRCLEEPGGHVDGPSHYRSA